METIRFLSDVLVYMESQEIYSDDGSYHSSQDFDYVYDKTIIQIVVTVMIVAL